MESALDLVASKATEKRLELGSLIEAHVPATVIGDVTRVRQILANMLSNAVKFTETGEVMVTVTAARRSEESEPHELHELRFGVKDTGIGIPADRMDRLFQSFSQVDGSTTRKYGGTGLGLVISKRLSELMGGTMWVESEAGKGSTFYFTIQAEAIPGAAPVYLATDQPVLQGQRILVVDDNRTNRKIVSLQTRSWGMEPVAVESGAEALDLLDQGESFAVAALDMQMPEMDGLTLADEIRRRPQAESLPLLMLTSLGERPHDPRMAHFAGFLHKPVRAAQFYNALVESLGGAPALRAGQEEETSQFDPDMGKRHPLRILLAEDNVINQKVAQAILDRLSYRADVAANGREAWEAVKRQSYDVVLMDMQMPELDGLDATGAIRREPLPAQPRIIAMTANAMQGDRERCLAAGMDDYVSKPVIVEELVEALKKCEPVKVSGEDANTAGPPADAKGEPEVPAGAPQAATPEPVPPAPPADAGEPETEGPPVFDPAGLRRLQQTLGKQAAVLLPGLIDAFHEDAKRMLAEARAALETGQTADLRRAGHTLKGNAANFGLMALAEVARELEHRAKDGLLEGAATLVDDVAAKLVSAEEALAKAREEL